MRKILLVIVLTLCLNNSVVMADWQKPEIKLSNTYRFLLRGKHGIYVQRGEIDFYYHGETELLSGLLLSPFIELHNNLQKDRLERKEVGLEVGTDITPWFYIGESLQYTRYNYEWTNYIWHDHIKYAAEAETRLKFNFPLVNIDGDRKISVYLLDEFTYSFRLDEATRNELVLGIKVPFHKHAEFSFGWRHIDRIHDFDSDALEANLTLVF